MNSAAYLFSIFGALYFTTHAEPRIYGGPVNQIESNRGSRDWTYADIRAWGKINPICNSGRRQSPIALRTGSSSRLPAISMQSYQIPFRSAPIIKNTGHTVEMEIPVTTNGQRPRISGGAFRGTFEAVQLHWHWGANNTKGSEHTINNQRYDCEMHIVHRNIRYRTTEEALRYPDGIAVITALVQIGQGDIGPGLTEYFNKLRSVRQYNSQASLQGRISLGQFLVNVNTRRFFTYQGSLTVPPCAEALTFTIFPQPMVIPLAQISRFWSILSSTGRPLVRNFRPLQNLNGRTVTYVS